MKNLSLIAVAGALVAACGGGGDGSSAMPPVANAPGSEVPLSATQDPDAAFAFVASVAASNSDSTEPLVAADAQLATSETEEPKAL